MDMVNVKVNGIAVSVPKGSTILEAARYAGVEIPTLCFLKDINEIGACRICVVEATGARGLVTACVYPVTEGMEIQTNTEKVQKARKTTLELILSTHEKKCLSCVRSGDCELQKLCRDYGVEDADKYAGFRPQYELDDLRRPPGAGQQQVHSLPPLRRGLQAAVRVGHRRQRSRHRHPHRLRV